jgi:hypothetical protein
LYRFHFFEILNGKDTDDYCQRVEPSPIGGKKLADVIVDKILLNSSQEILNIADLLIND